MPTAGDRPPEVQRVQLTRLFYAKEIRRPEDVVPHLAEGERHWREGFSAYELAWNWVEANGVPPPVRQALDACPGYRGVELVEGFFEREVDLRTRGRRSQTDLMALLRTDGGYAVLAVEGKVEEPFGPLVRDWRDGSPDRERRLGTLCAVLGLDPDAVSGLRYQLLHRAVSAVFEAQRYGCGRAMLLVHAFSSKRTSFPDFSAFSEALGVPARRGRACVRRQAVRRRRAPAVLGRRSAAPTPRPA